VRLEGWLNEERHRRLFATVVKLDRRLDTELESAVAAKVLNAVSIPGLAGGLPVT
jgi:hypothetical protein